MRSSADRFRSLRNGNSSSSPLLRSRPLPRRRWGKLYGREVRASFWLPGASPWSCSPRRLSLPCDSASEAPSLLRDAAAVGFAEQGLIVALVQLKVARVRSRTRGWDLARIWARPSAFFSCRGRTLCALLYRAPSSLLGAAPFPPWLPSLHTRLSSGRHPGAMACLVLAIVTAVMVPVFAVRVRPGEVC
jgi:hypothetical protein